jgi:hypothetical protein
MVLSMPRRPLPPEEYQGKHRHIKIYSTYWEMLAEICHEYIGIDSIPQCLSLIIKDLYDTIMSEKAEAEVKTTKSKERREYKVTPARPLPPP